MSSPANAEAHEGNARPQHREQCSERQPHDRRECPELTAKAVQRSSGLAVAGHVVDVERAAELRVGPDASGGTQHDAVTPGLHVFPMCCSVRPDGGLNQGAIGHGRGCQLNKALRPSNTARVFTASLELLGGNSSNGLDYCMDYSAALTRPRSESPATRGNGIRGILGNVCLASAGAMGKNCPQKRTNGCTQCTMPSLQQDLKDQSVYSAAAHDVWSEPGASTDGTRSLTCTRRSNCQAISFVVTRRECGANPPGLGRPKKAEPKA